MTRRRRALALLATAAVAAALPVYAMSSTADSTRADASAPLVTADGHRIGYVAFLDRRREHHTVVRIQLQLPAGTTAVDAFHGLHVHANNDPANGSGCLADPTEPASAWFVSADGHFAAVGQTHPGHRGDLPSVYINPDGTARMQFVTSRISPDELRGRAVILHSGPDNFGNVPIGGAADQYAPNSPDATAKTAATGNAGDRYACGVITRR